MAERRFYPLQALAEVAGVEFRSLGRLLGLSGSSWPVVRDRGATMDAAERYAVRLGLHPFSVWPEMADEAAARVSKPCVECGEPFIPTRKGHRFCSHNCRERRRMRKKYQSDPVWREQRLAGRRAYYEECADYEKAQEKRRYWENPEAHREARRARHRAARGAA